jgi:acyl carrier protein
LDEVLAKDSDWASFALSYNGPGYQQNRYDERLSNAYRRIAAKIATDVAPYKAPATVPEQATKQSSGANSVSEDKKGVAGASRTVAERVKEIVIKRLGVERADKVVPTAKFIQDLGADDKDVTELVMDLEQTFDIEITGDAAKTLESVGDAVRLIEKQRQSVR